MYTIVKFENQPIDSITYIISNIETKETLIIDPGTVNDQRLIDYLILQNLKLKVVFLTHEHFDHIQGVNYLREEFNQIKVIASKKTSERLNNSKKNLAIFHNNFDLKVNKADIEIEEGVVEMIGLQFEVLSTPGHTDSSLSLKLQNNLFSGDFLLRGTRVVTNLPTGSKVQYKESIDKYSALLKGIIVYPGHGESYTYI